MGSRPRKETTPFLSHRISAALILAMRIPLPALSLSFYLTEAEQLNCLPGQELWATGFWLWISRCSRQWDTQFIATPLAQRCTSMVAWLPVIDTQHFRPPLGSFPCTHLYEVYEGADREHYSIMVHFATLPRLFDVSWSFGRFATTRLLLILKGFV